MEWSIDAAVMVVCILAAFAPLIIGLVRVVKEGRRG